MLFTEPVNATGEVATWVTAIGTILLALVAVWQDKFRKWLTRPKLKLEIRPSPPDCHRTTFRQAVTIWDPNTGRPSHEQSFAIPCYYFRLRVTNVGNCEAREVEVFAKDLRRHDERTGEFVEVGRFAPMNLLWSNVRQPFLSVLSPQIPKHCDLAHVVRPDQRQTVGHVLPDVPKGSPLYSPVEMQKGGCVLALDLQVEPNSGGHLLGPGFYRLSLVLAAANSPPREYLLDIRITGDWFDEEDRMFEQAIRLHLKET